MASYAKDHNQPALYDEAADQILSHTTRLLDPEKKLYYQGWGWGIHPTTHSPGFWSRGNGWMILSFAEVLDNLPSNHPKRKILLTKYKEIDALSIAFVNFAENRIKQ